MPWTDRRLAITTAVERGGGPVAGRYHHGGQRDLLTDASGTLDVAPVRPRPGHGDHIGAILERAADGWSLLDIRVLTAAATAPSPQLLELAAKRPRIEARARVLRAIRDWFDARDFTEVETPARVPNPGLEPHLRPFPAGGAGGDPRWLRTSPELHLKRLLCAGYERVFELAGCFRDDERGAHHLAEFTLLEWYRAYAGLDALVGDVADLLGHVARCAGRTRVGRGDGADLSTPPGLDSYAALFRRHAQIEPSGLDPDQRELLWVERVEPCLGFGRPQLVDQYPPDAAALARLEPSRDCPGWPLVAARIELYVAGIELANGFDELTDPVEQRQRHEADRAARRAAGTAVPALDEPFLADLAAGMPPAAGIALGVDRLLMLVLDQSTVADVRAFAD